MDSFDDETFNQNYNEINDEKQLNFPLDNIDDLNDESQASSETEKVNDLFLKTQTIDEPKYTSKKRKRIDTKESDGNLYSKFSKSHLKKLLKLIEIEESLNENE